MGYDKQHVPVLSGAEGYELVAGTYDRDLPHYDEVDLQAFSAALPARCAGLRALDAGGGTGRWALRLLQRGASVVLADPAPAMLHVARAKAPGLETVVAPVEDLPFAEKSFDIVVCAFVLGYCDDLGQAIRELVRVTAPGGLLLLSQSAERKSPIHRVVGRRPFLLDVTYHRPEELASTLEAEHCTVDWMEARTKRDTLAGTVFIARREA